VRLFSRVGPVVLFVAALYYRFARHDALRFYVFFGLRPSLRASTFFATATTDLIFDLLNHLHREDRTEPAMFVSTPKP
jgi:hypothetical protein